MNNGSGSSVWPFDQEFHLIMNVAVGGTWGDQQGIDTAAFEGEGKVMEVDWICVYGKRSVSIIQSQIKFHYFRQFAFSLTENYIQSFSHQSHQCLHP